MKYELMVNAYAIDIPSYYVYVYVYYTYVSIILLWYMHMLCVYTRLYTGHYNIHCDILL
jgi:hypothetical protein